MSTTFRAIVAALFMFASDAQAADFPNKPVKIVVPFTPGTGADLLARQLSPFLQERWKQPVIVENRPGAGGQIGNAFVVRSPADGYTLLLGSQSLGLQKYLVKNLGFDPDKDLTPVYKVVAIKVVLTTNTETPAKTLAELATYSKQNLGKVFYGGTGPNSLTDQALEMIKRDMGMNLTGVSYPGPPQFVTALLRNDVQLTFGSLSAVKQHVDANKLRMLAVVGAERYSDVPDIPTLAEAGYKGFVPVTWIGLFAPSGTPKEIIDQLGRDFGSAMADAGIKTALNDNLGLVAMRSSPEAFGREYLEEMKIWAAAFKAANVEPQ